MRVFQSLGTLWEKIRKKIQKQEDAKHHPTDDAYKPSTDLRSYSYGAVHHHPESQEMQHRAEQHYWQEQLRLAEHLNVLTKSLNTITVWTAVGAWVAAIIAGAAAFFGWWTLVETINYNRLDQRPWVAIGVTINGPLSFGTNDVGIPLKITMKNVGNAPAVDVLPLPVMFGDEPQPMNFKAVIKKRCETDTRRKNPLAGVGYTIFPNDVLPNFNTPSMPTPTGVLSSFVAICVNYRFTFAEENHQTAYLYFLARHKPGQPGGFVIDPKSGPVPASDLTLTLLASYAD